MRTIYRTRTGDREAVAVTPMVATSLVAGVYPVGNVAANRFAFGSVVTVDDGMSVR